MKGIQDQRGAIGFFSLGYYFANAKQMRAVTVEHDSRSARPTMEAIQDGSYAPFSRPMLMYISVESKQRPEVDAFVRYLLDHAGRTAGQCGYVGCSAKTYMQALKRYEAEHIGTNIDSPQESASP